MKTKYILSRRIFNPDEKQKDIRTLVAKFGRAAKLEAEFCLKVLQEQSTAFNGDSELSKYRYELKIIVDGHDKSKFADLQIDDSKARRSGRAFAYELTWDFKHEECHMIAYHKLYGSVRAVVTNTVEARHWFMRALKRVWPNAFMSTK